MASVVIRKCASIEEAVVVHALLVDAGFEASVDNLNHAMMESWLVPALGGIQIRVPESQFSKAKAYIIDAVRTAQHDLKTATGELETEPLVRPHFRAFMAIFLLFGGGIFFIMPLILLLTLLPPTWFEIEYSGGGAFFSPGGGGLHDLEPSLGGILLLVVIAVFTINELITIDQSRNDREDSEPPKDMSDDPPRPL